MLRKFTVWALLVPLFLNGLWVVCAGGGVVPSQVAESSEQPGSHCETECALKTGVQPGSICLISPGGKSSLTIFAFGIAVVPPMARVGRITEFETAVIDLAVLYREPILPGVTLPPKA